MTDDTRFASSVASFRKKLQSYSFTKSLYTIVSDLLGGGVTVQYTIALPIQRLLNVVYGCCNLESALNAETKGYKSPEENRMN